MQIIDELFWQAFYNFAFWHGLRKGEQQALKWKDINFEKEEVKINKTVSKSKTGGITIVTTKNRKNRTIYLAKQSIEFLKKLKQFCQNLPKFNENWFVFGKGELITDVIARNTIDRHLKKQYNRLKEKFPQKNINILTHHEFGRHSHASYLLSVGATLPDIYRIIAIRLGDTEEVIKNTYAHPYESENNDKTKKLLNS